MKDYLEINALYHYGIKNQKWGIRRFQNQDGTLTAAGKIRYGAYTDNGRFSDKGIQKYESDIESVRKAHQSYEDNRKEEIKRNKEREISKKLKEFGAKNENDASLTDAQKKELKDINDKYAYEYRPLSSTELYDRVMSKVMEKDATEIDAYNTKAFSVAKDTLSDTSKIVKDVSDILPTEKGKYVHSDYSNIPNDELKQRIQRIKDENEYANLIGDSKYVKTGSEKRKDVLQTVGAVLAIASTASGIVFKVLDYTRQKPKKG